MSGYNNNPGNPFLLPPTGLPDVDSPEWRQITGEYHPEGLLVFTYRQVLDAYNGLSAHIQANPAFHHAQNIRVATTVRSQLEQLRRRLERMASTRNPGPRNTLRQRLGRAVSLIAATSFANIRELVYLRRMYLQVLDVYNRNSGAAERVLRAYVTAGDEEVLRLNNQNDANRRQRSEAAAYVPPGLYVPSVHSYNSAAQQSSTGSNVVGYSPAGSADYFYANQSAYGLQGAPPVDFQSSPRPMSEVIPQQPGQSSEDAAAALGEARLQAEEARLRAEEAQRAAAQRHGNGGGPSRPSGSGQGRPGGGYGGGGSSQGYASTGNQAYYHR